MKDNLIRCIVVEDDPLPREFIVEQIERTPFLQLNGIFSDAISAFHFIGEKKDIDLVFSDILMPGLSGMELLKSLASPPLFIFVTASQEYAVESFEYNVADYLVKPYEYHRFLKAANKARILLGSGTKEEIKNFITVKSGHKNLIVKHDDILFIKSDRIYAEIETLEHKHIVQDSLSNMQKMLPSTKFMRVHRSFIVNLGYIEGILPREIVMQGSIDNIPIGASYKESVYGKFGIE